MKKKICKYTGKPRLTRKQAYGQVKQMSGRFDLHSLKAYQCRCGAYHVGRNASVLRNWMWKTDLTKI